MKFTRKIFTLLLAICLTFSTVSATAFAAETNSNSIVLPDNETIVYQDDDVTVVKVDESVQTEQASAKATTYESVWLDSSDSGSFSVNTPNSGTIGITLKVESQSNDSWAYISVQKPNGDYFKNNVYIDPTTNNGEGGVYKMYFASSGDYTIHYIGYTSVGMRIMCWLY